MQITIQKHSREERDAFFKKHQSIIRRLWGIKIYFSSLNTDEKAETFLSKFTTSEDTEAAYIKALQEELDGLAEQTEKTFQEEFDLAEQIEEDLQEIDEDLQEIDEDLQDLLHSEDLEEEEEELIDELEEVIDDLQEIIDGHDDDNPVTDLTRINGLGPKTAEGLQEAGITSFQQIVALTQEEIEALDEKIRNFSKAYERNNFRQQAQDLLP